MIECESLKQFGIEANIRRYPGKVIRYTGTDWIFTNSNSNQWTGVDKTRTVARTRWVLSINAVPDCWVRMHEKCAIVETHVYSYEKSIMYLLRLSTLDDAILIPALLKEYKKVINLNHYPFYSNPEMIKTLIEWIRASGRDYPELKAIEKSMSAVVRAAHNAPGYPW
jgi:hypothetical protein